MKSSKTKIIGQFLILVVLFPLCFLALRVAIEALLLGFRWDEAVCDWIDQTLSISLEKHRAHRWLIDILTLFPAFWCSWFLFGAVAEIQYTHKVKAIEALEIIARWLAISMAALALPPLVGLLFFYSLSFALLGPLSLLLALGLTGAIFYWSIKLPGRRLRRVETIYLFERIKES
ncbi:MAG: hypothetical protein F6K11_27490 [Leptolyngbya sp. SIO3F4]|nr:hypothetical protein [Leptolyngbya sp. SIO3F4]